MTRDERIADLEAYITDLTARRKRNEKWQNPDGDLITVKLSDAAARAHRELELLHVRAVPKESSVVSDEQAAKIAEALRES